MSRRLPRPARTVSTMMTAMSCTSSVPTATPVGRLDVAPLIEEFDDDDRAAEAERDRQDHRFDRSETERDRNAEDAPAHDEHLANSRDDRDRSDLADFLRLISSPTRNSRRTMPISEIVEFLRSGRACFAAGKQPEHRTDEEAREHVTHDGRNARDR